MTAQTQTLTDFLLARIAEDAAKAKGVEAPLPVAEGLAQMSPTSVGRVVALIVDPARVLAECEAKRALVDGFDSWGDDARWALRTLALPYADHPDYRVEWRP